MLKILFFADTHLGLDYPIRPRIKRRRRGEDFFNNFQKVLDFARDNRIDLVVHGGDLFFRSKIPQKIVDKSYEILLEFAVSDIPLVLVPGNHERSKLPISLLLNHKNIHIFHKPQTLNFEIEGHKIFLAGFPYQRKNIRQKFVDLVKTVSPAKSFDLNFLCLHQVFQGSQVGPSDFTFTRGANVIKKSDIPNGFDFVFAGHIHRKQILKKSSAEKSIPIIYPGSTERTSFAERNETKGFFVLEFDKKEGESILDNLNFVKLPTRPMLDLKVDTSVKTKESLINWLQKATEEVAKNAILRLEFPNAQTSSLLTAAERREILPDTMNITIKNKIFHKR